jgi:hypothetical protein
VCRFCVWDKREREMEEREKEGAEKNNKKYGCSSLVKRQTRRKYWRAVLGLLIDSSSPYRILTAAFHPPNGILRPRRFGSKFTICR